MKLETQPETGFLLRWHQWMHGTNQTRARLAELIQIADEVGMPFLPVDLPHYRRMYLLASWLSANAGVDFEVEGVTLRIVKHPIVEGIQWFGILSGAVQSGDEGASE